MDRRQLIGAVLASLLVVVNVAVWFVLRQPSDRLIDTREILRDQLTSQWEEMPAASLDEVASALAQVFDPSDQLEDSRNAPVYGDAVSFRTLVSAEKSDLIEAIGGAVSAIASGDPDALVAYMADRGLEPDANSFWFAEHLALTPRVEPVQQPLTNPTSLHRCFDMRKTFLRRSPVSLQLSDGFEGVPDL